MTRRVFCIGGTSSLWGANQDMDVFGSLSLYDDSPPERETKATRLDLLLGRRPDWNRIGANEFDELIGRGLSTQAALSTVCLLPYISTPQLRKVADAHGMSFAANRPDVAETLESRSFARSLARQAGWKTINAIPVHPGDTFTALQQACDSPSVVVAADHSSGGAWVERVDSESRLSMFRLDALRTLGPDVPVEAAPYINGTPMNVTLCVTPRADGDCAIVVYPPSIQLTGIPELSDRRFRYCGYRYALPPELRTSVREAGLFEAAHRLGTSLHQRFSWKGLFGIDFLITDQGEMVFIEINARLQTSTGALQRQIPDALNPLTRHLCSFETPTDDSEDVDLTAEELVNEMELIAYNTANQALRRTDGVASPGWLGVAPDEIHVEPGGVLGKLRIPPTTALDAPHIQESIHHLHATVYGSTDKPSAAPGRLTMCNTSGNGRRSYSQPSTVPSEHITAVASETSPRP